MIQKLGNETPSQFDHKDLKEVETHENPQQPMLRKVFSRKLRNPYHFKSLKMSLKILIKKRFAYKDNNEIDLIQDAILLPAKNEHRGKITKLGN